MQEIVMCIKIQKALCSDGKYWLRKHDLKTFIKFSVVLNLIHVYLIK